MHRLPPHHLAFALLALVVNTGARANIETTLPIASTSVVEIDAMNFSGAIGLPIGNSFAVVPSTLTLTESAAHQSLVTTGLSGSLTGVTDNLLNPLSATLNLTVTSTFTLYYEGSLTATSGTFAAGVPDPITFAPAQPFEFSWTASGTAIVDFTTNPPGTTENVTGQSGVFVAGSNQVSIPLAVDLGGVQGNETITLVFDQVGVDQLLLNGVSLGSFSLASDGTFSYDDATFDMNAFVNVDLLNPVISFPTGTVLVSGSVNPGIAPVALNGTFVTSPVPLPATAPLLGGALALLAVHRRRRG